jgi:tripartite-type tricarboxylate transporter receptor subunit TctC
MFRSSAAIHLAVAISLTLVATCASSQAYPTKPIRVIVPYAAGGSLDAIARIYAAPLAEGLGQQIIVDIRPGANGTIGTEIAVRSPPDGYTLLLTASSSLTINPNLYRMRYDAQRDLAPISLLGMQRNVLTVHPSLPASNVKQFVDLARNRPGALNFASAGRGSSGHMAGELFKSVTGIDMQHVAYKGVGPATNDLVAGHVAVMFNNLAAALPFVKSGRLRALAVTGATRSASIPELPTMSEAGYPSVDVSLWEALLAPAATPSDVIARLNSEVVRAGNTAEIQQRLAHAGIEVATSTPGEVRTMLKNDTAKWAQVVKKAGLAIE